jgi:hypothetical protein
MAKPQEIREELSRYICSILWVQEWAVQDPLKNVPTVGNKQYPPNVATELPVEQLEILRVSERINPEEPNKLLCFAKFPFRISYVFKRDIYQTYRSIPIKQLENLLFKCSQLLILFADSINPDIEEISIPRQQNPIIWRVAEDIRSDAANSQDWLVTLKLDIDITFISSPAEFAHSDWVDIQPISFPHPDGVPQVDVDYQPFDLNEITIEVNRSKLPRVNTLDENTFTLDEILILERND